MQKLNSAPETQLSFGWQRVFASLGWRKSYSIFPCPQQEMSPSDYVGYGIFVGPPGCHTRRMH